MDWKQFVALLYLLPAVTVARPAVETLTVRVPGMGPIIGSTAETAWTKSTIYQFRGIKFAEPPIGDLRFKLPVPKAPWTDLLDTTQPGRPCPGITILDDSLEDFGPEEEDCISLSIYTKNLSVSNPVMVYIHGGAFYMGAGYQHPPNYLLEKDIVLVVPQYRLGPLGFLSMKSENLPGNAAIFDVILALKWVQAHVRSFGGDPERVTLVGQSAGAGLINALAYSPVVEEHLYQQVILQSGGVLGTWVWDENPERNAREIAFKGGCNYTLSDVELEDCLKDMDLWTLWAAFASHMDSGAQNGQNAIGGHRITIGGPTNFLPTNPFEIMSSGGGRRNLRMMTGVTKNEGTFALIGVYDTINSTIGFDNHQFNRFRLIDVINRIIGISDYTGTFNGFLSKSLWKPDQQDGGVFEDMIDGLVDLCGVGIIKGPVLRAAQGNAFFNPNETWLYSFDYMGEHTRFGYGADTSEYPFEGGVTHSDDNIYLFPWPPEVAQLNEEDTEFAKKMVDLWTSFVSNGEPHSPEISSWPPMTNLTGPYLHIEKDSSIGFDFNDEYSVTAREGIP
uniref:Carboxylic ester hydrolase n=1 Tax=Phlebotomus papatasi TaxID=29031 RepID=A0A1B0CZT2_PHLPP